MFFLRKKNSLNDRNQTEENLPPAVLVVEDDRDQLELLSASVTEEVHSLLQEGTLTPREQALLSGLKVIRVGDLRSLEQAASQKHHILLTILDCQIPEQKGGQPNDQFDKQNKIITGQHRSVDAIIRHHPNSPILLISSLNRFRLPVTQYYKDKHGINMRFVSKDDFPRITARIGHRLRAWLSEQA